MTATLPSSSCSATARSAKTSSRLGAATSSTLRRVHGNASGEFSPPTPSRVAPRWRGRGRSRRFRTRGRCRSVRARRSREARRSRSGDALGLGARHEDTRADRGSSERNAARPVRCCSGSRRARRSTRPASSEASAASISPPTTIRACTPPRDSPSTCPMSSSASMSGSGTPAAARRDAALSRTARSDCGPGGVLVISTQWNVTHSPVGPSIRRLVPLPEHHPRKAERWRRSPRTSPKSWAARRSCA